MTAHQKLSEKIFVVDAEINIWSGQRKLDAADIRLGQGGELPPEKVANLGNKKIADPESLRPFHRVKTSLRRYLNDIGMPFLGGWACPLDKFDEVKSRMENYQTEFEQEKLRFLADYNHKVEEWLLANPDYEDEIRRGVMHRDDVEKRIRFGYHTFKLIPAVDEDAEGQRLERRVAGLGDELLYEVADAAARFADQLIGREQIAVTTSITLKGLRDKIEGLAFLNGNLQPIADLLTDTLSGYQLHRDGRNIVAPFIYQVQAVALTLADVDRIERFARGEIDIDQRAKEVEELETGHYPAVPTKSAHPLQTQMDVEPDTRTVDAPTAKVGEAVDEANVESEATVVTEQAAPAPAGADMFADLDDFLPVTKEVPEESVAAEQTEKAAPVTEVESAPAEQKPVVEETKPTSPEPETEPVKVQPVNTESAGTQAPVLTVVSDVVVTAPHAIQTQPIHEMDNDGLDGEFGF